MLVSVGNRILLGLTCTALFALSSCAGTSSRSDDYYSYSNSGAAKRAPSRSYHRNFIPEESYTASTTQVAPETNDSTEHAMDDSLSTQDAVNQYYASPYTPVITPWWNSYYAAWPSYRQGLSIGVGFGYSPWTSWSSWYDPYAPAPYFSWGWNWYTPWYSCNPYYGFGYDPFFSFGYGYGRRYAGWYSPWYVPHSYPEHWPGWGHSSWDRPRSWTTLHGAAPGGRSGPRSMTGGQNRPPFQTTQGTSQNNQRSTFNRPGGSVFTNPTTHVQQIRGNGGDSRSYRTYSGERSVQRSSIGTPSGSGTASFRSYTPATPRASFGGGSRSGGTGSSAPRGSSFSSHASGGHRR